MYVATLIASPHGAGLPLDCIETIARRLRVDMEAIDWLHEGFAVDLPLAAEPDADARLDVARMADEAQVDCVVQPVASRRKRLLVADMDSTMIEQECIDELADLVGVKDRVAEITARAMNGEIAFEPALRERVALLEGIETAVIDSVVAERITLAPGGRDLVRAMKADGARTVLVSGGFTVFTDRIGAMIGFDEAHANVLVAENGRFTGRVEEPILGSDAKLATLNAVCETLSITPAEAIAVGDGANDLAMILAAGTGVALHAKPRVAAEAPHRIDYADLTALLYVQGHRASEFAE